MRKREAMAQRKDGPAVDSAGIEVAEKQFRKVKGCKEIPVLIEALAAHAKGVLDTADKLVA